ncbi:alpha/beta fold hydrolase [Methylopila musalis]|uniref:Alpha/beta fold hydrolase n=1 Tax=Methylopila musalis TaxID=1134781 RepID=A0ABW3Z7J9_9HYPH
MFDRGRVISAGEAALYVAEAGRRDGAPIVLLHGGLGGRSDFEPLAAHLAAEHRLVVLDSRGHGRSPLGDAVLSYRQLTEDVAAVLAALDLGDAGIIGHSDGGIVALRLAASGLARPRFLVTVGAHGSLPADDPTRALYRSVTAAGWREMFPAEVARYEAENPAPDFERLFEAVRAMWLGTGPDAYPDQSVRRIAAPLLVVHGDEDILVSRAQAFELAEGVAGARLLNLPFASHTVLQDSPAEVAPALTRFIAGIGRDGTAG